MIPDILLVLTFLSHVSYNFCAPVGEPLSSDSVSSNADVDSGDLSVLEYGPGYATYGHRQMETARSRGITPLVDNIKEYEKYGNDGDFTRIPAKSFVRLTESISGSFSNNIQPTNKEPIAILKFISPFARNIGLAIAGL